MSKSALIIIDIQSGMYDGKRIAPIFEGEEKIERIKHLLKKARSKEIALIYIKHNGDQGHPLEKNTEGWRIHKQITPKKEESIIEKKYPDSFQGTQLLDALTDLSISNLYIVGNQTEYCIDTTCRSAFSKGFQVLLIEDCHSTWDSDVLSASQIINHHNETLRNGFVMTMNSKDVTFNEFEGPIINDKLNEQTES